MKFDNKGYSRSFADAPGAHVQSQGIGVRQSALLCRQAGKLLALGAFASAAVAATGMTAFAAQGWITDQDGWHYVDSNGSYATDCFKRSGDNYFYLDSNGDMVYSSIVEQGENYYYVNSQGAMVSNEWREVENTDRYDDEEPDYWWYYLGSNGRAIRQTGSSARVSTVPTLAGNAKFIFDEYGHILSGWISEDGQMLYGDDAWREGVYYADPSNGQRLVINGWAYIDAEDPDNEERDGNGYWFFFDAKGRKVTDNPGKLINGYRYRFNEYGVAQYDWYEDASDSNASPSSYYYSDEAACWLRTDWFKAIPDPETDPDGYDMGEEYWYYADKRGKVMTSQIKNIRGQRYGFDEFGKMLHGLYILEMDEDGTTILDHKLIETIDDLPEDEGATVYYFGDSPKEGAMQTGNAVIELDGERLTYRFKKSGDLRGSGVSGLDGGCIYINGLRMEASDELRYEPYEYGGKTYLISAQGKIMKGRKNIKDADGNYYCTDKDGVITYEGEEKFTEKK